MHDATARQSYINLIVTLNTNTYYSSLYSKVTVFQRHQGSINYSAQVTNPARLDFETNDCQMIRDANKVKRLEWARRTRTWMEDILCLVPLRYLIMYIYIYIYIIYIIIKDMDFDDVIYTDESTVQVETHHLTCCFKRGLKPC